jgi:hypothetical protein
MALRSTGDLAGAESAFQTALKFKSTRERASEELRLMGITNSSD